MDRQVGLSLASWRTKYGLSQIALSQATGVTQKTISRLETGKARGVEFETLRKLAHHFGCLPGELISYMVTAEADEIEGMLQVIDPSPRLPKKLPLPNGKGLVGRPGSVHFIGIGGIIMNVAAKILLARGYTVTGSDIRESPIVQQLRGLGVEVEIGHSPQHVKGAGLVIYSAAISENNEELQAARLLGLPWKKLPEIVPTLVNHSASLVVIGNRGTTQTTALLALILQHAGLQPAALLRGDLPQLQQNQCSGQLVVAEMNEMDDVRDAQPDLVLIRSSYADHFTLHDGTGCPALKLAMAGRLVVLCLDDPRVRSLAPYLTGKSIVTYGVKSEDVDFRARIMSESAHPSFELFWKERPLGTFRLQVEGEGNIYSALGAIVAAWHVKGVTTDHIQAALRSYTGVERQTQSIGAIGAIPEFRIFEERVYHPKHIQEIVKKVKVRKDFSGNITVIFQLQSTSQVQKLTDDFKFFFSSVFQVVFTGTSVQLSKEQLKRFKGIKTTHYWPQFSDVVDNLPQHLKKGDILLILGNDNIHTLSQTLYTKLQNRNITPELTW